MIRCQIFFLSIFLAMVMGVPGSLQGGTMNNLDQEIKNVEQQLLETHGEAQRFRIEKGVRQVASFWTEEDGSAAEYATFCREHFIGSPEKLRETFSRLEVFHETLNGHFNKMLQELKQPLHLDWGPLLPVDHMFGRYNPAAHLAEDFFQNKIAFYLLLNFPYYTLEEKIKQGADWTREEWAYARMGDEIVSRVPAKIHQKISSVMTEGDTYISEYNIYMGNLVNDRRETLFPPDLKLISHWGLRDELKAQYADPDGLTRQEMIFEVMKRIIRQEIPGVMINRNDHTWDPFENKLYRDGKEITPAPEPDTRYMHFLETFRAMSLLDPYYPQLPTHILRKFERDREIPETEVEQLFVEICASPQIRSVGKLIEQRLGRKLKPFDIWYDGFKSRSSISEDKLDAIVRERYADVKAFEKDIPNILVKLGFSPKKAKFIADRVVVDPARGAGHAWGADMKSEKAHLRTRVPKNGMNYKGFNIAMHELGHTVEQTLTLQDVDYYSLHGVPNTAFTEAFAFVFQARDLEVLGMEQTDPTAEHLDALDSIWATYEIAGVSLVDMKVWRWMYENPDASPADLKEAVIRIAKEVWNHYYADVFGVRDEPILAIYSHMIDAAMYLPDYPLGHLIEFQITEYLKGKNLGTEMQRICSAGLIVPGEWMKHAVGAPLSAKPMLHAADRALEALEQ